MFLRLKATMALIILNIIAFLIASQLEYASLIFGLNSLFITEKFIWQPLSSMFMHGGFTHLFMNMVVLFQFGSLLEQSRGAKFFTMLYLIGGIITSLLTLLFMETLGLMHVVVGASGALCVIMGYLAFLDENLRKGLIVAVLLISFLPLLIGMPIAWYAHLIGFGVGYIFSNIFSKKNHNL